MNTRTADVRRILTDILKTALQQGITPDITEIIQGREMHDLGEVKTGEELNNEIAISSEMNSHLEAMERNIRILDEAASLQTEDTVNYRGSFPSRIAALNRWYHRLAFRAQNLLILSRSGTGALYTITESFTSLDNLDMDRTTAYIDTQYGYATLNYSTTDYEVAAETGRANVFVTEARIVDGQQIVPLSPYNNTISYNYVTNTHDYIDIEIQLRVMLMNTIYQGGFIEFDLSFPEHIHIQGDIIASSEGRNEEKLSYTNNFGHYIIPVSQSFQDKIISFTLRKTEHEGVWIDNSGQVKHQFLFDFKNLRLPNRLYREDGFIFSNPYALPEVLAGRGVGQAKLTVDHMSIGDYHVDSYLAFDSGEYQLVQSGEPINMGMLSTGSTHHPACFTVRDAPTPLSKLVGETLTPVMESSVLLEGYNQVEIESKNTYDASYNNLSAWAASPGGLGYQDLSQRGIFLKGEMVHKVYFNIKSDHIQEIILTNIGVQSQEYPGVNQADFITLYFNGQTVQGKRLPDDSLEYRLVLLKGVNNFNILVGIDGIYGGWMNLQSQFNSEGLTPYVKERRCTSIQGLISLDDREKAYAVQDGNIFLNYIPPYGAHFLHRYTEPTGHMPVEVSVKLNFYGNSIGSPFCTGYKLEFSPGAV